MIYLTRSNFSKLIRTLVLDIPSLYKKNFYWETKLQHFSLDLAYFTEPQAHVLTLGNMLYQDIENTMSRTVFAKLEQDQTQWVYPISQSAYHKDADCPYLHSDFTNVRIPSSLETSRVEEYRTYFIENVKKYGYAEALREPMIFCRKLKEKFNLQESLDHIEQYYFRKEFFANSEMEAFNATLDFDLEIKQIQEKVNEFNAFIKFIRPENARRAFLLKKYEDQKEQMEKLEELRLELLARILNFYFQYLNSKGFDISENIMHMAGFKPCKCCKE